MRYLLIVVALMVAMSGSVARAEIDVSGTTGEDIETKLLQKALINTMDELVVTRISNIALSMAVDSLSGKLNVNDDNFSLLFEEYKRLIFPGGIERVDYDKKPIDWESVFPELFEFTKNFVLSQRKEYF